MSTSWNKRSSIETDTFLLTDVYDNNLTIIGDDDQEYQIEVLDDSIAVSEWKPRDEI